MPRYLNQSLKGNADNFIYEAVEVYALMYALQNNIVPIQNKNTQALVLAAAFSAYSNYVV